MRVPLAAVAVEEIRAPRTGARRSATRPTMTMIFNALSLRECSAGPVLVHGAARDANRTAPTAARRGVSSALLPTLAAIVAGRACSSRPGNWQRSADARRRRRCARSRRGGACAPVALSTLPASRDWAALRYPPVVARRAHTTRAHQILIDNRVHAGRVGYHVVTPLMLADGRAVLVDRGCVAAGRDRARCCRRCRRRRATSTVRGRIDAAAGALSRARADAAPRPVWQNLDPARFAAATGVAGAADRRRADARRRARRRPGARLAGARLRHRQHRIYMVQWYRVRGAGASCCGSGSICARAARMTDAPRTSAATPRASRPHARC